MFRGGVFLQLEEPRRSDLVKRRFCPVFVPCEGRESDLMPRFLCRSFLFCVFCLRAPRRSEKEKKKKHERW